MSASYVLIHGSPGNAGLFAPFLELAPAGVRCEAWDLLDHGPSHEPDATLDETVDDLIARVAAMDDPCTLVGHSFGTWVIGRALPRIADRVDRFVAIGGLPGGLPEMGERFPQIAAALESGQLPLAAVAQICMDLWLPQTDRDPAHVARIAELIESDTPPRVARVLRRLAQIADPERFVKPYTTATTLIHCKEDRAVPIGLARELAALGTSAEMIELEGDSHFPHWTNAARVAEIVFGN